MEHQENRKTYENNGLKYDWNPIKNWQNPLNIKMKASDPGRKHDVTFLRSFKQPSSHCCPHHFLGFPRVTWDEASEDHGTTLQRRFDSWTSRPFSEYFLTRYAMHHNTHFIIYIYTLIYLCLLIYINLYVFYIYFMTYLHLRYLNLNHIQFAIPSSNARFPAARRSSSRSPSAPRAARAPCAWPARAAPCAAPRRGPRCGRNPGWVGVGWVRNGA